MARPVNSRPTTPVHQVVYDGESLPIGQTLKDLRAARRLTQQDLADAIGISASYLSLLESGKRRTTGKILRSLADYLKVPSGYLVVQTMQLTGLDARHQDVIQELRRELVAPALERAFTRASKKARLAELSSDESGAIA